MFHRKSTKEARNNVVVGTNTTVPRRPSPMHPTLPIPKPAYTSTTTSHTARAQMKSPAPSSISQGSVSAQKPSSLPRPTSRFSEQRRDALASSRSYALTNPSAHSSRPFRSGSENVPLIFDGKTKQAPTPLEVERFETTGDQRGLSRLDMEDDTVLGLALPTRHPSGKYGSLPPDLIPELQALATQYHKPVYHPPPSVSTVSSPSTRLTESPAPWSASTATTTPVSWPSTSPAVVQTSKLPGRKSKTVPQPTVPRSRLPKLPTLQHSVSLSKPSAPPVSSKDNHLPTEKRTKRKPIVESPAPTPPPRKSSTRGADGRGDKSTASSIDETLSRAGSLTAPPSSAYDSSPLASRTRQRVDRVGDSLKGVPPSNLHTDLQRSISSAPSRPSRDGGDHFDQNQWAASNEQNSGLSNQYPRLLAPAFDEPNFPNPPARAVPRDSTESNLVDSGSIQRSPSKLGRLARLGLFTRRGNTPSSDVEQSPKKLQRRGPTAGTGHEGYSKHSRRSRKPSNESSGVPSDSERSVSSVKRTPVLGTGRKSSVSSSRHNRSSQSDLDEFAAPRMKPVFMRGGSQSSIPQPEIVRSTRWQANTPEQPSSRTSSASPVVRARQTPTEPPRLRSPRGHIGRNDEQRRPTPGHAPTLAQRRSQRFGTDADNFRIPQTLFTNDLVAPTQITSHDTSMSSAVPSSAAPSSSGADLYQIDPSLLRPSEKKSKRAWWNPFRRRTSSTTAPETHTSARMQDPPELAVSIPTGPAPRSIPYYAMLESESDNNVVEQIGEFLSEAVESIPLKSQLHHQGSVKKTDSMLLPTAPVWLHPPPPPLVTEELQPATDAATKQTRLAQVGRIPKVVSRSERQHVPSRRSFSQPFALKGTLDHDYPPSPRLLNYAAERPHLEIYTDVLPSRPFPDAVNISAKPASAPAAAPYYHISSAAPRITQRTNIVSQHGSSASASSSSDGMLSIMGPPLLPTKEERSLAGRMPKVRIPSMQQGDDEIWKEYDDFIDHVMSPSRSPKLGPRLILDQPEPQSNVLIRNQNLPPRPRARDAMPVPEPRRANLDLPLPSTFPGPARVPSPSMLHGRDAAEEIRLRRSRIISALHSSIDASSPFSMREFLMDYGEHSRDSFAPPDRLSASASGQPATITPTSTAFAEPSKRLEHTHREHALLFDTVARSKDPARESELHYASLEVSRWLSFGRVLFSPAHEELHMLRDRNVLVIDGLGNEDWSMYCAEFYQTERATVYDLQEGVGSRFSPPTSFSGPPNHRRAEIDSFSSRFPFQSAFFSAIVLRFPPALSEAKMQNLVTECRRILVPGGHLEIMLLDLDIVNMGVQTRRAVKELKITMATSDPEVSLRPGIDNFQNILGGRGFTGLNRCVVGVPVVGRPSGSMDSSSSSHSSRRSSGPGRRTSEDPAHNRHSRNRNFSLSELVADHSEKADAQIGRLVSSCARSWWTHVYEAAVIADGDLSRSIFADKRVLQECKSRASSFKLLIAYAQRPVFESRRRTMSEPGGATLATAGSQRRTRAAIE